jgi:hypothetical protein
MLKNITPNTDLVINTLITSEDYSSDRDFFNKKILDFTTNNVVNNISDSEIYEYKPNLINSVNFNIFFLKYIQDAEINDLTMVMESDFNEHLINTKERFNLVPNRSLAFNNIYAPKQSNSLVETELIEEIDRTKISNLLNKPYFVRDIIGESLLKKPENNGLPVFYNSFTFPFWSKRDLWLNDPLLYSNKPYFYNSFLLMEFFDSTSNLNQNRIQSIPIFVNPRYNIFENPSNKQFTHERPCFNLKEGVEGFSFFFLNNYITNEFYVRFSFWDSLSGNQIPLLPSSTQEYDKKWLQNPDTFKQEARYLKYVLDYNNKTYKIYEFNSITNTYDLERNDFDLYELAFDSYFNLSVDRVPNKKPINAKEQITPTITIDNPLKFDIKNLTFDYENTTDFTRSEKLNILNRPEQTYLRSMGIFIDVFNNYISNSGLSNGSFTDFETKDFKIPTITDSIVNGTEIKIKSFTATNIDDNIWRIRRVSLEDINLKTSTKTFNAALYKESNSTISDKQKFKVAESIIVPDAPEFVRDPLGYFTETLYNEILDDIFPYLLRAIELNRRNQSLGTIYNTNIYGPPTQQSTRLWVDYKYNGVTTFDYIPKFLDDCIKLLNIKYPFPTTTNHKYINRPITNIQINDPRFNFSNVDKTSPSEIFYAIPDLVKAYNFAKENQPEKYDSIKEKVKGLMVNEFEKNKNFLNLNRDTFGLFFIKDFNPLNYPQLIDLFLKIGKLQYVDNRWLFGSPGLFSPLTGVPDAIRSYGFDIVLILNGDNFAQKGEQMSFDLFFNIGEYAKHQLLLDSNVNVTGKARISLINDNNDIKNIIIPIDFTIKP